MITLPPSYTFLLFANLLPIALDDLRFSLAFYDGRDALPVAATVEALGNLVRVELTDLPALEPGTVVLAVMRGDKVVYRDEVTLPAPADEDPQ